MTFRDLVILSAFPLLLVAAGIASCDNRPCVTLPEHSSSDLACNSDSDCTSTWSGTVCGCSCNCGGVPANNAAKARDQEALSSVLFDTKCSQPPCSCPRDYIARCVANQCILCGDPSLGPLPGQPAACNEDAGAPDAGMGD
jgi:hypothetical protein